MPHVHVYFTKADGEEAIRRAEEYAAQLMAELGLERGQNFEGEARPAWFFLPTSCRRGDHLVIVRHDTAFSKVKNAKWYREPGWREVTLHYADLGQPASQVDYTAWLRRLKTRRIREAYAEKHRRHEFCGGIPNRPGYKVVRNVQYELRGTEAHVRKVKKWLPDVEQFPILRLITWLRNRCVARKSNKVRSCQRDTEVVPAWKASTMPPRPGFSKWEQPSWEMISDCLERCLARREARDELPRKAVGKKGRRPWHRKRLQAAHAKWPTLAADWQRRPRRVRAVAREPPERKRASFFSDGYSRRLRKSDPRRGYNPPHEGSAPTLPAEEVTVRGVTRWRVWCSCGESDEEQMPLLNKEKWQKSERFLIDKAPDHGGLTPLSPLSRGTTMTSHVKQLLCDAVAAQSFWFHFATGLLCAISCLPAYLILFVAVDFGMAAAMWGALVGIFAGVLLGLHTDQIRQRVMIKRYVRRLLATGMSSEGEFPFCPRCKYQPPGAAPNWCPDCGASFGPYGDLHETLKALKINPEGVLPDKVISRNHDLHGVAMMASQTMTDHNPYASPKAPPAEKLRRPLRVYFAAAWAGFMAGVLTFAGLAMVELVIGLIFWPELVRGYKSVQAEAEFWRTVLLVANLVVALPVGAWAANRQFLANGDNRR